MKHLICFLTSLLVLTLCINTASATVITWTNVNSGNWSVAANWSPNFVPGSTDTAYLPNTNNQTVTLGTNVVIAGLSLSNGTLYSSSYSLTVNGPFTWSGGTINNNGGGDLTLNGASSFNGVGQDSMAALNGLIINAGVLTWTGSGTNLYLPDSTITNLASGTISIAADVSCESASLSPGIIGNAGLVTKTNSTGTTTLGAVVVNTGTIAVQSGILNLIGAYSYGGGTEAGPVTIASGSVLNFGPAYSAHSVVSNFSSSGPGTLMISGAVNFNNPAGNTVSNMTVAGGTLGGAGLLAVNGQFTWSSGTINNTGGVTLNGTSSLNGMGNDSLGMGGRLINAGALTWSGSGSNLYLFNAAPNGTLTNLASGTITVTADVSSDGGGNIGNAGLLTKAAATGTSTINAAFVNASNATLEVQSGTLNLNNGGTQSGTITNASGTTLNFSGGTHTVLAGFSATGPGSLTISGGTVNFNSLAASPVSNLELTGGTLGGTGLLAVNGPFTWSGGTIYNSGGVTLNGMSSLNGVGKDAMTLAYPSRLINAGTLTWSGSGSNLLFNGGSSATITNLASGTITIATNVSSDYVSDQQGIIGNAGLVTKTGTAGTSTINAAFVNASNATLEVQSGTLNLNNGGTQSGTITNASGTTLNFSGGTHTVLAGFSATGPGSLIITGGTVNFNSLTASPVSNLELTGGTLGGTGLLAVNGPFTWSGGTVANTGGVTLNGISSLNGNGNDTMPLSRGLLINAGALTWSGSGSNLLFNGGSSGTLTNLASGTITITADVSSDYSGVRGIIGNAGLMIKTNSTGTTTLNATVVNTGNLNVQSGTISLAGAYTLTKGTLDFGISGANNFGNINLSGAASFNGGLGVNLNGLYWPTVGSSFNLLTYTSESGVLFTNTSLPPFITWQTNYNPTVFTLSVVARQTNAAPTNLTMSLAGNTSLNLAWPGDHTGWQLEAQTNSLQVGLSTNWVIVPGSGLTNEMTFPIGLANGAVFFRLMYP